MKTKHLQSLAVISLGVALLMGACAPLATQATTVQPAITETPAVPAQTETTTTDTSAAAALQALQAQQEAFIALYEKLNPSVVNIRVVEELARSDTSTHILPFFGGSPDAQQIPDQGEGAGFVYDTQGHIVTNNHVVSGAGRIVVTFSDGTEVNAELVGTDPGSDLAVIKVDVEPSALAPVTLGDSASLKVGQIVVAIGNPFGLESSMTTGIISGLGRMLSSESASANGQTYSIPNVIQTDAAINPGNSGGPLITLDGRVIGINTAIESPVRASAGVGYAVPSNLIASVVPQLIAGGSVQHPWLGISGTTLNADIARAMKLDADQRGVLVVEVVDGSPAAKAGVQPSNDKATIDGIETPIGGDVITGINDQTVRVFDDLLNYIMGQTQVGQKVTLHILRGGKALDLELTLSARPKA